MVAVGVVVGVGVVDVVEVGVGVEVEVEVAMTPRKLETARERDEARATKDMHKERAEKAEAERREANSEIATLRAKLDKVCEAGKERLSGGEHDALCPGNRLRKDPCTCGYEALDDAIAAARGAKP